MYLGKGQFPYEQFLYVVAIGFEPITARVSGENSKPIELYDYFISSVVPIRFELMTLRL